MVVFFLQQVNVEANKVPHSKDVQNKNKKPECILPSLQELGKRHGKKKMATMGENTYEVTFLDDVTRLDAIRKRAKHLTEVGLGQLVVGFFKYYAFDFKFRQNVVSIRKGDVLPRVAFGEPYTQMEWRIAIEDPFELQHDLGSKISCKDSMRNIMDEIRRAAELVRHDLTGPLSNSKMLEPCALVPFPRRCFTCGSTEHRSRQCPIDKVRSEDKHCHRCGDPGHIAKDCPRGKSNQECFLCGNAGHLRRDCPSSKTGTRSRQGQTRGGERTSKDKDWRKKGAAPRGKTSADNKSPKGPQQGGTRKPEAVYPPPVPSPKSHKDSRKLCRHFMKGTCGFGSGCKFSHEADKNHPPGF